MGHPEDAALGLDQPHALEHVDSEATNRVSDNLKFQRFPENVPTVRPNGTIRQAELSVHRRVRELANVIAECQIEKETISRRLLELEPQEFRSDEVSQLYKRSKQLDALVEKAWILLSSLGTTAANKHSLHTPFYEYGDIYSEDRLYSTVHQPIDEVVA